MHGNLMKLQSCYVE